MEASADAPARGPVSSDSNPKTTFGTAGRDHRETGGGSACRVFSLLFWGHHTIRTKSYAKPKNKRNQMVIRSIGCASDQPQIANHGDFSSNTFSDIVPGGQGDHQAPVTVRFCTNRVVTPNTGSGGGSQHPILTIGRAGHSSAGGVDRPLSSEGGGNHFQRVQDDAYRVDRGGCLCLQLPQPPADHGREPRKRGALRS
jgi:hypothetical protein